MKGGHRGRRAAFRVDAFDGCQQSIRTPLYASGPYRINPLESYTAFVSFPALVPPPPAPLSISPYTTHAYAAFTIGLLTTLFFPRAQKRVRPRPVVATRFASPCRNNVTIMRTVGGKFAVLRGSHVFLSISAAAGVLSLTRLFSWG